MSSSDILGAYLYPCFANKGKISKVKAILKQYRLTANVIASVQWRYFFVTQAGKFNKILPVKSVSSSLSERYKQTCLWQVVGVLDGYIRALQVKFIDYIANSTLSETDRIALYGINYNRLWFKKNIGSLNVKTNGKSVEVKITPEQEFLARKIFHHLLKINRKPVFKNVSMHLDSKVAVIQKKQPDKAREFDYWIKLSTLDRGNPILLPLKANSYAEKTGWKTGKLRSNKSG